MSNQRVEMRQRQPADPDEPEIRTPGTGDGPGEHPAPGGADKRKIDLSVPQVAGSAVAAVIAAKLASTLGVYGTIVGAGVISVIATCGGPLFQQLFTRTGKQVRDVTTAARPKARQVPAAPSAVPADDRRTLMLGTVPEAAAPFPYDEEFGAATTHGTRLRGWRRPVLAAALVFGVTMGGITAYELVSGEDFSGTKGTTTFGSVVRGGDTGQHDAPEEREQPQEQDRQPGQDQSGEPRTPAPTGSAGQDGTREPGDGTGTDAETPATGATPGSGTATPGGDATTAPTQEPTGSGDGGGAPTQEPTAPTTAPTAPATPSAPTEAPAPTGPPAEDAPTAPAGGTTG
ncbi:hypothetical protein [Streptomyces sp. NPDC057854]|uniref:hypothetical protein n=1 Tax=unclassified Streptomyces TaxID=2593676 RepID=UPI0036A83714